MASPGELVIGRVPFLVCAPFFHASLEGVPGFRFVDGAPAFLNRELSLGRIDCAPSSSIEYGRRHREYKLLPGISTSSRLEMKSVLLLSRLPWENLGGEPVALSPDSDTSNILFRILCDRVFKVRPTLVLPSPSATAAVFIGDRALEESLSERWPHHYDLAGVWAEWQGLPFSFGLWMVRRRALEEKPAAVAALRSLLDASLASFRADPAKALEAWTRAYPSVLPRDAMLRFYQTADYGFTPDHARSLQAFFRLACEGGYLEEIPEPAYVEA